MSRSWRFVVGVGILVFAAVPLAAEQAPDEVDRKPVAAEGPVIAIDPNFLAALHAARERKAHEEADAKEGNAVAQFDLAERYLSGDGFAQSDAEAVRWYSRAAEQGYALAQFRLGSMYYAGRGVSKDLEKALSWYLEAARQGMPTAQYNVGVMYRSGEGVPQDRAQAEAWFTRAAEQGHPEAANRLRDMTEVRQASTRSPRRDTASESQPVPLECFAADGTHCPPAGTTASDASMDTLKAVAGIATVAAAVGSVFSSGGDGGKADAADDQGNKKADDCRRQAEASIAVCNVSFGSCTSYGKCDRQVSCSPGASCGSFLTHVDFYDGGKYYCDNRPSGILSSSRTISKDRETTLRNIMKEICP